MKINESTDTVMLLKMYKVATSQINRYRNKESEDYAPKKVAEVERAMDQVENRLSELGIEVE